MDSVHLDTTFEGFDLEAVHWQGNECVRATVAGWSMRAVDAKMQNGSFEFMPGDDLKPALGAEWSKAFGAKRAEDWHVRPVAPPCESRAGHEHDHLRIMSWNASRTETYDEVIRHFAKEARIVAARRFVGQRRAATTHDERLCWPLAVTPGLLSEELSRMRPGKCARVVAETINVWPLAAKVVMARPWLLWPMAVEILARQAVRPASWTQAVVILFSKLAVWRMYSEVRPSASLAVTQHMRVLALQTSTAMGYSHRALGDWISGQVSAIRAFTGSVMAHVVKSIECPHEMHLVKTGEEGASIDVEGLVRRALERAVRFGAPGIAAPDWVRLHKGLPQGCPETRPLFTVVLEEVLRDLTRQSE